MSSASMYQVPACTKCGGTYAAYPVAPKCYIIIDIVQLHSEQIQLLRQHWLLIQKQQQQQPWYEADYQNGQEQENQIVMQERQRQLAPKIRQVLQIAERPHQLPIN